MKTIAITMDAKTLESLDELIAASPKRRNRSAIIRAAVQEYTEQERRRLREEHDARILRKHRGNLARQARALVAGQALP